MQETHNFIVLGGSGAGLGIAHSFLKHIEPELAKLDKTYHPTLPGVGHAPFGRRALRAHRRWIQAVRFLAGGGPTGVEITGEIGHFLNGSTGWFSSRSSNPKAKVTVVTKGDKLLPVLNKSRALWAETLLNRVGVDVVYNVSVVSSTTDADGKTTVDLSNGEQWTADVYIPAWGVTPNSEYVPANFKNDQGYIKTNEATLRADAAGPRVYVAGDVGDYSRRGFHNLYSAIPVLAANIKRDLLAAAASDSLDTKPEGLGRSFTRNSSETQAVPIGPAGVGAVNGWGLPSFLTWLLKGRNYMIGNITVTVNGDMVKRDNTG